MRKPKKKDDGCAPSLENNLECFFKPLPALLLRDVIPDIMNWCGPPAHTELQAPAAEDVGRCHLLSHFYRAVQRQQCHRSPQANP